MGWPSHRTEQSEWTPRGRQGPREDRTLKQIEVELPPMVGRLSYDPVGAVARA